MVENFTQETTYENDLVNEQKVLDAGFEAKLKENLHSLMREPRQSVIDNILSYSKSFQNK